MTKKLIISLSIIGVVAAVAIGGTIAYFNDVETSTGNVFTAGTLDLKVDHVRQTYNDVDCRTCRVTVISDTSNSVVSTVGGADPVSMPHPALLVSHPHVRWTADVGNPAAKWIWATNPTLAADTYGASYTFARTFDWYGPFTEATLSFSVGSDNSVVVYLNDVEIGRNDSEFGYQTPISVSFTPTQGANELKFVVTNWNGSHDPVANPGGLLYALTINGNCGDDYFKTHCTLWGLKDLASGDHFFMFEDVKPGDRGTNVISLHSFDNDAYACLIVDNKTDAENDITNSESKLQDTTDTGELSQFIEVFGWNDIDKDGVYEPLTETTLFDGSLASDPVRLTIADSNQLPPLSATTTYYVGLAWCAGTQTVNTNTGAITCDGSGMGDIAQSDSLTADVTAYIEQWRNNSSFDCDSVNLR